jgi:hypothetical protein
MFHTGLHGFHCFSGCFITYLLQSGFGKPAQLCTDKIEAIRLAVRLRVVFSSGCNYETTRINPGYRTTIHPSPQLLVVEAMAIELEAGFGVGAAAGKQKLVSESSGPSGLFSRRNS